MPFYLYQLAYSSEAIKSLVAKPSDRKAAAQQLVEAGGGKLHDLYFAFGKYDVVCIIEQPDDTAAASVALAVGASGAIAHAATTKLLTPEEAMKAMDRAGKVLASYRPPMA